MLPVATRSDAHGNPASGSPDAVDRYDVAIDHLLAYRSQLVDAMTSLATDEPDFAMGLVLAAYMSLTSTDVPDLAGARQLAAQLDTLALNERETAHRDAVGAWLAGDWHGTARRLDTLLLRWPGDLLGLLVGHQLDFFLGDAANLRDRVGRSLFAVDPAHPHHGYVRGMYAFGLEESGNYQLAEHHGLAALDRNRGDVWATHAVVHVYEMQGRVDDGIRFLRTRQADWADGNLFNVHNWWHLALYLLEAGRTDESLAIYDERLHNEASAGVPLEMVDASALLWRLRLDGVDTGGRFAQLADVWATRTSLEPWYVFNDLHAVMAQVGAGRLADARAVIDRLDAYIAATPRSTNVDMTAEVGLPACRSVLAHAEARHADVVAELLPIRTILCRFGGSHAQRDVLQRTLVDSAFRSGHLDLARALLDERLGLRETSVWSWRRRSDVLDAAGDMAGAALAAQRAATHAARSTPSPARAHLRRQAPASLNGCESFSKLGSETRDITARLVVRSTSSRRISGGPPMGVSRSSVLRPAAVVAVLVAAGATSGAAVEAVDTNTCQFDPATGRLELRVASGSAGASVRVDATTDGTIVPSFYEPGSFGRPPTPIPCGSTAPTVTNVDLIRVRSTGGGFPPGSWLRINEEARRFEPGRSAEPTGVSEIEFDVDLGSNPNALIVEGAGDAAKQYAVGVFGVALNNDDDLDVALAGTATVSLVSGLGSGTSLFSGQGGFGTGAPTTRTLYLLADRSSADNTLVGGNGDDHLQAGGGNDTVRGMSGNDSLVDTTTSCCGQAGGGADRLEGGPGNDGISSQDLMRDVVIGGPGFDTARVDRGLDAVRGVERIL